jgi:exodeoxyribonuclease V gamma subunit
MATPRVIHIYRSNRVELLVDELARFVATPLADPLQPESFLVQGRGMALYLMMELANRFGISANLEFSYPRNFVHQALDSVLGSVGSELPFDRAELRWHVMAELPKRIEQREFQRLREFLSDDPDGIKRLQLASRIAQVFDQYLTYRPDMIRAWEAAPVTGLPADQSWQPLLWRALAERLPGPHLAARELRFHEALVSARAEPPRLPSRISIFGISTLPPLYVRVIASLSALMDIRFFLFSPCKEFWADLPGARQTERSAARGLDPALLHLEAESSLLASLGRLGAEFQEVLTVELERVGVHAIEHDLHCDPANTGALLGRLQHDVLHMTARPEPRSTVQGLDAEDRSIVVHSCHSPMRQVEVLHDRLLECLSQNPDIAPRDVIVMMPDVEEYAPFIEAVFGRDPADRHFIPYHIADRSLLRESPVIEAFFRILQLVGRRAKASEILDLLTLDAVARKQNLSPDDVEKITRWVIESNIRWGIDGEHRKHHDQPEAELNTWRFGLRRLLVGYALPGNGTTLFHDVLPYDEIEGQDAELLGTFTDFASRLFATLLELERSRGIGDWQTALSRLLDDLLHSEGAAAWQAQRIRTALSHLVELSEAASFDAPLSLSVITRLLEEELNESQLLHGFLSGGVTFSAMVPMRSIPFKVVCLLGMNESAFPRPNQFVDFDLTRHAARAAGSGPRAGDRSRRDDDRYLFLEALMAARERLMILYTGQSIRDNSRVMPSVVVSELIDHLIGAFGSSGDTAVADERARVVTFHRPLFVEHPLQPFSARYFDGSEPELFSYARSYYEGAASLRRAGATPPFFSGALIPVEPRDSVALVDLVRFFEGPIRYLLNRRLRVFLHDRKLDVLDREPWELSKLDEWGIGRLLLELELCDGSVDGYAITRASGELPPGVLGKQIHERLLDDALTIAGKVQELQSGAREPSLTIDVDLPSGVRVTGQLAGRWPAGLVLAQYSRTSGKHLLSAWIRHLALCSAAPDASRHRTTVVGRPKDTKAKQPYALHAWGPVPEPERELARLVELYRLGEQRPLLLFPRSSFEYAHTLDRKPDREVALKAARQEWRKQTGSGDLFGECADPHLLRVFGEEYEPGALPPFEISDELDFEALALRVFEPLIRNFVIED